jgi:hypothetical protein
MSMAMESPEGMIAKELRRLYNYLNEPEIE